MKRNLKKRLMYIILSIVLMFMIGILSKVLFIKSNLLRESNVFQKSVNVMKSFFIDKKVLDVSLISQLPELKNGCEVTSVNMALNYKGVDVDKITLASNVMKDLSPLVINEEGTITNWGNPKKGFVGDITGTKKGYSIDPEPLIPLIEIYYKGGVKNISGLELSEIENAINNSNPVVVWINADFIEDIEWINWNDSEGKCIKANLNMHCVLVTGYDEENIYYNDPLREEKDKGVSRVVFTNVWNAMGRKALEIGR